MRKFSIDDLQGKLLVDLTPGVGVLAEISFEHQSDDPNPVLLVVHGVAHAEYIRTMLRRKLLLCFSTPNHKVYLETLEEDIKAHYPNLFVQMGGDDSDDDASGSSDD